jgi:hypothetical protein
MRLACHQSDGDQPHHRGRCEFALVFIVITINSLVG